MIRRTFLGVLGVATAIGLVATTIGFTGIAFAQESTKPTLCRGEVRDDAKELVDNILSVLKARRGKTVTPAEREFLIRKVAGNTENVLARVYTFTD